MDPEVREWMTLCDVSESSSPKAIGSTTNAGGCPAFCHRFRFPPDTHLLRLTSFCIQLPTLYLDRSSSIMTHLSLCFAEPAALAERIYVNPTPALHNPGQAQDQRSRLAFVIVLSIYFSMGLYFFYISNLFINNSVPSTSAS